MITKIVI